MTWALHDVMFLDGWNSWSGFCNTSTVKHFHTFVPPKKHHLKCNSKLQIDVDVGIHVWLSASLTQTLSVTCISRSTNWWPEHGKSMEHFVHWQHFCDTWEELKTHRPTPWKWSNLPSNRDAQMQMNKQLRKFVEFYSYKSYQFLM